MTAHIIKLKEKPCKGLLKAKGYGCGILTDKRKNGLCHKCWPKWYFSTEEGQKRVLAKAKKEVEKVERKETREKKIKLLSTDKYRAKYVQPIINEIARLIDYGQPCIATGLYEGKMNGGHYHAVGSNRTLALNLHNVHIQSFHSNHFKSGDNAKYRDGLKIVYGQKYLDYVESLNSIPAIHLSKSDLEEIKVKAEKIRSELKGDLHVMPPLVRIATRENVNYQLGIYKDYPMLDFI